MSKVFSTDNVALSVIAAHEQFTHIVVNRSYQLMNPVYFKSGLIAHLPVFIYADWDKASLGQLAKWREQGGVLIDRSSSSYGIGDHDALIHVECPSAVRTLDWSRIHTEQQTVVFKPPSWRSHFETLELKIPSVESCRKIWNVLRDIPERASAAAISKHPDSLRVMTDSELCTASGLSAQHVMYMRHTLRPHEVWSVKLRIKPEDAALVQAWNDIEALEIVNGVRQFVKLGQPLQPWRRAVKEMARQGHISLTRMHVYPVKEPNFDKIQKLHDTAFIDLQEIQRYVEALPAHLST
jgi:hypothetical protein